MIRLVFFGTPDFATIVLDKLAKSGYKPLAVFRNPKESTSVLIEKLKRLTPDLVIVAAYGKILPKEILGIPRYGFINVHPSLLPKYRGASPIQYAILNGDKETGVTIMKIDEEMDHGPILAISKSQITNHKITYLDLSQKLAILGAELLIKVLPDYISGKIKMIPQDHSKATYTRIIKREYGKIDWSKSTGEIERMTRSYYPWPSAYSHVNLKYKISNLKIINKKLKIVKIIGAEVSEDKNGYQIGEVFLANNQLTVKCGEGNLVIKKLQLEGGKILAAKDFLNGHKNFIGSVLE